MAPTDYPYVVLNRAAYSSGSEVQLYDPPIDEFSVLRTVLRGDKSSLHDGFKHCRTTTKISKDKDKILIDEFEAILVDEEDDYEQNDQHLGLRSFQRGSLSTNLSKDLNLNHIVFGIAGSVQLWPRRKEFVKLWWRPGRMRGFVWLEEAVRNSSSELLPPIKISEDISRFRYTNPTGHPSGLRIARIIQETFKMGLPDVKWFVLGDDDTIFKMKLKDTRRGIHKLFHISLKGQLCTKSKWYK